MGATSPTTRMQGCLYMPSAVTVRYTHDPTGLATVSDYAIAAGTLFESHDHFYRLWQARLDADLLLVTPVVSVGSVAGGLGYSTIVTNGANLSVDWSFAGSGTTLSAWLGFPGNLADVASPYTCADPTLAAYYPTTPAQMLQRTSTSRPRSQFLAMNAGSRTQHNTSPSDVDEVELDVELRFGPTSPHVQQGYFAGYFLSPLASYSSEWQWTLTHGSSTWFVAFAGDDVLRLRFERRNEGDDSLWRLRFPVRLVGAST